MMQRHAQREAQAAGAAESEQVAASIQGWERFVCSWQELRETDELDEVAAGGGNFYYPPDDVYSSIRTDSIATTWAEHY